MTEAQRTLSERETDVLRLLATGATNQQIADDLVISVNTVKVHLRNIFDKLGAQTRTEATLYAIHAGLVPLPKAALDEATRAAEAARALEAASSSNGAVQTDEAQRVNQLDIVNGTATPTQVLPAPAPSLSRRLFPWLAPLLVLVLVAGGAWAWRATQAQPIPQPTVVPSLGEPAIITTAGQRWTDLKPLPTARGGLALVAQGDSLYAIGGQTESGVTNQVERFTLDNSWSTRQSKPTPVRDISAVVVGGQVYVPGGCDASGKPVDVVEVYQPATDQWTTAPRLPYPLCGYALATVEGKIYLMGGWDGTAYRNETLILTPGSQTWQTGPPMPTARAYGDADVVDGNIYVIGGTNGASLAVNEVLDLAVDPTGSAWKTRAPMPEARTGLGVAAAGRRIYALGGGPAPLGLASYDTSADTWRVEETSYPGEWRGLGLSTSDLRLYAMGGDGPLNTARAYQALFQIILPMGRPNP